MQSQSRTKANAISAMITWSTGRLGDHCLHQGPKATPIRLCRRCVSPAHNFTPLSISLFNHQTYPHYTIPIHISFNTIPTSLSILISHILTNPSLSISPSTSHHPPFISFSYSSFVSYSSDIFPLLPTIGQYIFAVIWNHLI